MLAIARKSAIREQLQEHKSVRIADLAEQLDVTSETIRRDLREMEQAGELTRTHGGAYILDGVQNDIDIRTRQVLKIPEKKRIAEKCDQLIQTGDYLFLDGSTTCWFIARQIAHRRITVLTSSLEIANILSKSDTVKLYVIGGEYSQENLDFTGDCTVATLERYHVDKAIISCRSLDMTHGLTDTNDRHARLHRTALEHARLKYLALDHSKLNNISFSYVAPITMLSGVILDQPFPDDWKQFLAEHHIYAY